MSELKMSFNEILTKLQTQSTISSSLFGWFKKSELKAALFDVVVNIAADSKSFEKLFEEVPIDKSVFSEKQIGAIEDAFNRRLEFVRSLGSGRGAGGELVNMFKNTKVVRLT